MIRRTTFILPVLAVAFVPAVTACGDDSGSGGSTSSSSSSAGQTGSSSSSAGSTANSSTASSTSSGTTSSASTSSSSSSSGGGASDLVINEVTSNSKDNDRIELFNGGNAAVDLEGYSIIDASGDPENVYVFPTGATIAAGGYLVLVGDTDHMFGIGADDAVVLRDEAMATIDTADWAQDEALVSYCRTPNGTGAFQTCAATSWGAANP